MISYFEKRSPIFWAIIIPILILAIGGVDILTGYEMSFSLFYLAPIALAAWFVGRRSGVVVSIASAFVWFFADIITGHPYSSPLFPLWNAAIRFGFFIIVTLLLSGQRKIFNHEKESARTDSLTGAVNAGFFSELLQMEIDRARRTSRPFTVSYLDLDNFKTVNDRFGHSTGDRVLKTIVQEARSHLRKSDVVARLGGDEFAVLLIETDQEAARQILPRMLKGLAEEMQGKGWPVTFSIGVLTCAGNVPQTADELISQADELMYSIKNHGKNSMKYLHWADK